MSKTSNSKAEVSKYNFFVVHPAKMALLTLASILLYLVYWEYRNWQAVKIGEKSDTKPFWRAVLNPLFTYTLFKKMGFSGKRAAFTITALVIPIFAGAIWPQLWWAWTLVIPGFVLAQADYNKRNSLQPKFMFTLKAAIWTGVGLLYLAILLYSGIMTKSYSSWNAHELSSQTQGQVDDTQKQQPSEEKEQTEDLPEQSSEDDSSEEESVTVAAKPTPTVTAPKASSAQSEPAVSAPKAAAPQPVKKPAYQILNGGRLNISLPSIHIQRSSGQPRQLFTISSPDGKNISYPQTVGTSMWLAASSSQPDKAPSYTLFLQTGGVANGTYTVTIEALHSTDDATWRYTGSVLVQITD